MVSNRVREIYGTEFSIVPEGLAEDQVVSFIDGLIGRSQNGGVGPDTQSSLLRLAEQTVLEAHKLAEGIEEEARQQAETQATAILTAAEAKAQEHAERILKAVQSEADAKSSAIIAKAEQEAQQFLSGARKEARDVLLGAKQEADDLLSEAKLDAEFTVRKLAASVTDEIRSALTYSSENVLPAWGDSEQGSDDQSDLPDGKNTKPTRAYARGKGIDSAKR